ncbi:uncharacterized protein LOC115693988 [Syzygium oleosum]|uniref:uncharacterized protein LOC115693988 n=1 Tax=Syzygium oleosum TaxID=219896 RepID=UPI0011D1B435|nr:uncharacterized protein LOC115693988 [Syzygium oleosum]
MRINKNIDLSLESITVLNKRAFKEHIERKEKFRTKKKMDASARAVRWNYDVFLSFRGGDTRTGFADFLYNSLVAAGVHVFRDDNALPVGKQLGPELFWAIRSCGIAIPILSEQYAESKWCLRELAEIMDCHAYYGKSVYPIFYKVDVDHVRLQRGNFEEALRKHKERFSSREVLKWREALTAVARIRGWISNTVANGHEGELVNMVVAKVSSELKMTWIERLPMFPILMSNYCVRSVRHYFLQKKRRESKWQVFLAFRGSDTRFGLAAYLYISLMATGIRVFNDDDPFLIGKDIDHETRNAIDCCRISIPILSENFAKSKWCLDELAHLVDCKKRKGQKILPIFYKVTTSHVKDQFRKDMAQNKESVDGNIYEGWERALKEVESSHVWVSQNIDNGHEGVLVKLVVKEVSRLLNDPQTRPTPKHISRM